MPAVHPSIRAYLESLPGGIDAHPECAVKASLVRNAVGDKPLGPAVALPAAVRALVDAPPPVSVWVPEVHFHVVTIAIREAHFGAGGLEAYFDWVYDQNRRLFSTPLYRALFLIVSPSRLLLGMEKRWGSFRRGTSPSHVRLGDTAVDLIVRSPPHLYVPLTVQGMSVALRAAIDCAGAKRSRVEGELRSPTEVVYHLSWT